MPFRRVEGAAAGPTALGVLVPPGRRTMVILRPKHLEWDLVPVESGSGVTARLWEMDQRAALALVQALTRSLGEAAMGGFGRIDAVTAGSSSREAILQAVIGPHVFVVCRRRPGQAYEPLLFADMDEAERAAQELGPVLLPASNREQELYFNTQHFAR